MKSRESVRVTEVAVGEITRAFRGPRSQEALARRVGLSAATIAAWENGRRQPPTSAWFGAAQRAGVSVDPAFAAFHDAPWTGDLAGWLSAVNGDRPRRVVAERSGWSVHQVGRWLTGRAEPRAHQFLDLVDAMTGRVDDLVAAWVDIAQVPSLRPRWIERDRARRLAWEQPWSEAVVQVLLAGATTPAAVARAVGVSTEQAHETLRAMTAAGLVSERGDHYAPLPAQTVDTRGAPERLRALKRHWARVAADHTDQAALCAYNVFSCTAEDMAIVREELRAAFRRARARIAASPGHEAAALLLIQLLPFEADGGS